MGCVLISGFGSDWGNGSTEEAGLEEEVRWVSGFWLLHRLDIDSGFLVSGFGH